MQTYKELIMNYLLFETKYFKQNTPVNRRDLTATYGHIASI